MYEYKSLDFARAVLAPNAYMIQVLLWLNATKEIAAQNASRSMGISLDLSD